MSLYQEWIHAKTVEAEAIKARRSIENKISEQLISDYDKEGSMTRHEEGYKVKVTIRYNRTIDSDKLQEIAASEGLQDHLSTLFRWKPEVQKKLWDAADESITRPLAEAITIKPGRPSYSIEKEE